MKNTLCLWQPVSAKRLNVFCETDGHAYRVTFDSPVLLYSDMQQLLQLNQKHYGHAILSMHYDPAEKDLEQAINDLCDRAVQEVRDGAVWCAFRQRFREGRSQFQQPWRSVRCKLDLQTPTYVVMPT